MTQNKVALLVIPKTCYGGTIENINRGINCCLRIYR
jgi:hypothetical protein